MADTSTQKQQNPAKRHHAGRLFPDPDLSGYENVVGTCSDCGSQLIVNRATDLRNTFPSSGLRFRCFRCHKVLRVSGDIANHPVDQFVYDAYQPFRQRRYMQVVVLVSQSLELALVMCAAYRVLGSLKRPKRLRRTSPFAAVSHEFEVAVDKLTLEALRRVVLGLAVNGEHATSLAEARELLSSFRKLRESLPSEAEIENIADPALRGATRRLLGITDFVKFRNKVVHEALRPTQPQAEKCCKDIGRLPLDFLRAFGVVKGQLIMPPRAG